MNVLDLFSGIGGFSLGLERAGMTTVAFCEIEPYPQAVLRKNFPGVPIYDDVRTITAERLRTDGITRVDLVCGGFPCQPFSVAGKQQGKDDHRHLWPEMFRIIQETKPAWVIGENVAGFVSMALCEVSADLEGAGYEVQPFVIPACAVNAPHRRDRVWIVAHSASEQKHTERGDSEFGRVAVERNQQAPLSDNGQADNNSISGRGTCANVADTESGGLRNVCKNNRSERGEINTPHNTSCALAGDDRGGRELVATGPNWSIESPFCGVANGIPRRMDRLKALGNSVVPQIPEILGRAIMAINS